MSWTSCSPQPLPPALLRPWLMPARSTSAWKLFTPSSSAGLPLWPVMLWLYAAAGGATSLSESSRPCFYSFRQAVGGKTQNKHTRFTNCSSNMENGRLWKKEAKDAPDRNGKVSMSRSISPPSLVASVAIWTLAESREGLVGMKNQATKTPCPKVWQVTLSARSCRGHLLLILLRLKPISFAYVVRLQWQYYPVWTLGTTGIIKEFIRHHFVVSLPTVGKRLPLIYNDGTLREWYALICTFLWHLMSLAAGK